MAHVRYITSQIFIFQTPLQSTMNVLEDLELLGGKPTIIFFYKITQIWIFVKDNLSNKY